MHKTVKIVSENIRLTTVVSLLLPDNLSNSLCLFFFFFNLN